MRYAPQRERPGGNRGDSNSNHKQTLSATGSRVKPRSPCAWLVAPGVVRIQVHEPRLTQALRKVADHKQVAYSVAGGYLRIFQFPRPLAWAQRWIARHTSANEAFPTPQGPQTDFVSGCGWTQEIPA